MSIAELELETGGRALGGRFTTAEGLLRATADQLRAAGDAPGLASERLQLFIEKLQEVLDGNRAVTIVLDDPAGNSYVQSLADDPTTPDEGKSLKTYRIPGKMWCEDYGLNLEGF
nr:zinc finger protein ZPR1-like [Plodia interpunctella]